MSFSDEVEKIASNRFTMVRLEPGQDINDELTSMGGSLYTATFTDTIISKIQRNGTSLTKVTTPSSDGEFSFNESTGLLTVFSSSAPSSTTTFIMLFYLFYTTEHDRLYPESVDAGETRCWEARIKQAPSLSQNVRNLAKTSKLTSAQSNLVLINTDRKISDLLSDDISFKQKQIETWLIVNGEIQKSFKGITKSIQGADDITIGINDYANILLNNKAYFGDVSNAIATRDKFSDLRKEHEGRPIPFIFGNYSPFKLTSDEFLDSGSSHFNQAFLVGNQQDTLRGVDIGSDEWILCRIPVGASLRSISIGTRTPGITIEKDFEREDTTEIGRHVFSEDLASSSLEPGDYWEFTCDATTCYALTSGVDVGSDFVDYVTDRPSSSGSSGTARTFIAAPAIIIRKGGKSYMPYAGKHFTTSLVATDDGKAQFVKITFTSAFFTDISDEDASVVIPWEELNNPPRSPPGDRARVIQGRVEDMTGTEVFFRINLDTTSVETNHSDVLKELIEDAGLTADATSFATAKSDLAADVQFSIPFLGQANYGTFSNYIEAICRSSLGIIHLNNSQEVVYQLLKAPDVTEDIELTDDDIIGRATFNVEYQDIVSQIQFSNKHVRRNFLESEDSEFTVAEQEPEHLHDTINKIDYQHILADITGRSSEIINFLSKRFVIYTIKTASRNLVTNIFDTVKLSDNIVIGGGSGRNMRVLGFQKSEENVTIFLSDLLGL